MDENYEPQPVLAESYEVSEDGLEYTIKLREGVKFHNGNEMTADDVVASMNRWIEKSPKANTLIGGSTFEKVDDYTVKMTANQASSDIITVLANPIMFAAIYPAEMLKLLQMKESANSSVQVRINLLSGNRISTSS